MRIDPTFRGILTGFDLDRLDDDPSVVFGVFADRRLGFANKAWDEFATENGAPSLLHDWPIGRNVFDAISPDLRQYYRDGWEWATESKHPWSHSYDCSSATRFRRMRMTCYGLGNGAGTLVVNSLIADAAWPEAAVSRTPRAEYRGEAGHISQCPNCRRTRHIQSARWDWVPEWVQRWPDGAHATLCNICKVYYYAAPDGPSRP